MWSSSWLVVFAEWLLLLYDLFNRHNSMTTVLMLSDVRVVYE